MTARFLIAVLSIFVSVSRCAYTSSSSISTCITYENSASYKWCRYSTTTFNGYACDASDTSTACGGSSSYRCSSDSSSYLPQNSKKLLCPTDYTNCNLQETYFYPGLHVSVSSSNTFGTSTFCWYKLVPYTSTITILNVSINSMVNANSEIYYESSTNIFTYKGSLASGNSMNISVSYNNPVWVLVTPTSDYARVTLTTFPIESASSSSIDNGTLIAIILPITVCCAILICFVAWMIVCKILRRKRILEAQSNARAAITTPREPIPQPQLYYPQNQTYNNISINPPPSTIYTLPPTFPPQQHSYSAQQQMFIMEPVPLPSPSKQGPYMFPPVHQPAQPFSFVIPTDANLQIDIPDQSKVE